MLKLPDGVFSTPPLFNVIYSYLFSDFFSKTFVTDLGMYGGASLKAKRYGCIVPVGFESRVTF